jgi:formylmethanofuran dehydrogenase subunit E
MRLPLETGRTLADARNRDVVADDMAVALALRATALRHERLCPRQVLGVRIGFAGLEALGLKDGAGPGRVHAFVETDGCFADGVEAATGSSMGHRTMRLEDYGRAAATFVDVETGAAVRVAPAAGIRERASVYDPGEQRRYYAQLHGYQRMPADELLTVTPVALRDDIDRIRGRKGTRVDCDACGEEVINQREVVRQGATLCLACAGPAYYEAQ